MKDALTTTFLVALTMAIGMSHSRVLHRHIHRARADMRRAPADADDNGGRMSSAMGSASSSGNISQLRVLFARGAHANYMYENGEQPLLLAVNGAHVAAVRLLITHGANLYGKDNGGYSALEHAKGRKRFTTDPVLRAKYDKIIVVLMNAGRKHEPRPF